jgi:hypothetical protein
MEATGVKALRGGGTFVPAAMASAFKEPFIVAVNTIARLTNLTVEDILRL